MQAAQRQVLDNVVTEADPSVSPLIADGDHGVISSVSLSDLLNRVPPHLIGDQVAAEARRTAGVSSVALYVVDIDGSRLRRVAGSQEFPGELDAPLAVGPEIPRMAIAGLRRQLAEELPGTVASPLFIRGRAIGLLLSVGGEQEALDEVANHAAMAIELARRYTDVFAMSSRHRATTAASEIQQNLLPPRVVQMAGAGVAGNVLPSYDVGGDWFDYAENPDGAWLGVADATGKGASAASLGSLALGAFRAARRSEATLAEAVVAMHEAVSLVGTRELIVTAIIGRWHAPTAAFTWINCGHPHPVVVGTDGKLRVLGTVDGLPLGTTESEPSWAAEEARLQPGERLVLHSDGISERPVQDGGEFGIDGIERAVASARSTSAAATVRAIQDAVMDSGTDPLEDDATLVVLIPTSSSVP